MISWGNWSVRVYAAMAWVSLAPRFAADRPEIVDRLETILTDMVPAVRLQAAQNLQVISEIAPERMWVMGERIAATETDPQVLVAYLGRSLRRLCVAEPSRCEYLLAIAKERLGEFVDEAGEHRNLLECLGAWGAQLHAMQGRSLAREWLDEWAADPVSFQDALNAYTSSLREVFFARYAADVDQQDRDRCDRAQDGLTSILTKALDSAAASYSVLASNTSEVEKSEAGLIFSAAEGVIHHATNQLYFGAGAFRGDKKQPHGLISADEKKRFLADYADVLMMLGESRNPATLHHLVELYEHLVPGNPTEVFTAMHALLTGRAAEEGYQFESLGSGAVVRVVGRYVADHRGIFEAADKREMLLEILQLFSEAGWTEAIRMLHDLPDLLR